MIESAKRVGEALRVRISRGTVHGALTQACRSCKTPVAVAQELPPQWAGWLHLDGKGIQRKGLPAYAWGAFLAQDTTGDLVPVARWEGAEQRALIRDFLLVIRETLPLYLDLERIVMNTTHDTQPGCDRPVALWFGGDRGRAWVVASLPV